MRKVIQIAVSNESETRYQSIIALCDDGSIWEMPRNLTDSRPWARLPEIPQEDEESYGSSVPSI